MPTRHPRWILLTAATGILVAAVLLVLGSRPAHRPSAAATTAPALAAGPTPPIAVTAGAALASEVHPTDPQQTATAVAAVERALATGSLRDSSPDGAIELDANGRLRTNLALRRWFDWYLSLVGEVPPQAIRTWIAEHVSRTQPPAVAGQVLRALDAYLAYLADVDRVARMQQAAAPAQRLQWLKDLRRQHLGTELADGFFGDEERYGDFTLARQALQRDTTLTAAERAERLRALEADLPESVRQPLALHRQVEADFSRNAEITAGTSDPISRFAERERAFGAEAAARLDQLDQEQARWQQRLRDYAEARARMLADQTLAAAERETRLAQLRAQSFDASERQRVEALEQVDALPH